MNADTMKNREGEEDAMNEHTDAVPAEEQEKVSAPIDFDDDALRDESHDNHGIDGDDHSRSTSSDDADGGDDGRRVLLDETEYGAVKDGVEIKAWQIDGLMRDNGKPHSPVFLKRNPPKLTFKSRNSDADTSDEYVVFLDKASSRMLRDALINVCNAYELKPVRKKRRKWTWKGFKDYVYDSFTDDPLKFIVKIALLAIVIGIFIFTSFSARW